mgnify:CR=1 FL=1
MAKAATSAGGTAALALRGGGFTRKQIAGWQGYLAYLGAAAALIGALRRCFLQVTDKLWQTWYDGYSVQTCPKKWQKGRFPAPVGVGAIL